MAHDNLDILKAGLSRQALNIIIEEGSASLASIKEVYGEAKYGNNHPVFTQELWRYAVQSGETIDSYWDWAYEGIKAMKKQLTSEDYARAFGLPG